MQTALETLQVANALQQTKTKPVTKKFERRMQPPNCVG